MPGHTTAPRIPARWRPVIVPAALLLAGSLALVEVAQQTLNTPARGPQVRPLLQFHRLGVSLEPGTVNPGMVIREVRPGFPASHAGLRAGDTIVTVDGQVPAGFTLPQYVARLSGRPGHKVTLGVIRAGQTAIKTVELSGAPAAAP